MRFRPGAPWMFIGAALIALGLFFGWLGLRFYDTAESTRASLSAPGPSSRENDLMVLAECNRGISTCAIVGSTLTGLGAYLVRRGMRMSDGGSMWALTINR